MAWTGSPYCQRARARLPWLEVPSSALTRTTIEQGTKAAMAPAPDAWTAGGGWGRRPPGSCEVKGSAHPADNRFVQTQLTSRPWTTTAKPTPHAVEQETVAIVLVRDDGTCTVAWAEAWHSFDQMPGTWPSPREAMRSVERVVATSVVWRQTERHLWEGRVTTRGPARS